MKTITLLVT